MKMGSFSRLLFILLCTGEDELMTQAGIEVYFTACYVLDDTHTCTYFKVIKVN